MFSKDTQVWINKVLMIIELQASRSIGDALRLEVLDEEEL
jgi:hypothetical protein